MTVTTKSIRIYQEDYDAIVRVQGFLQARDGRLLSIPEVIHKMRNSYVTRGKLPEMFTEEKR